MPRRTPSQRPASFTKQHYVVDVPAGAALGWAAFQVFRVVG